MAMRWKSFHYLRQGDNSHQEFAYRQLTDAAAEIDNIESGTAPGAEREEQIDGVLDRLSEQFIARNSSLHDMARDAATKEPEHLGEFRRRPLGTQVQGREEKAAQREAERDVAAEAMRTFYEGLGRASTRKDRRDAQEAGQEAVRQYREGNLPE